MTNITLLREIALRSMSVNVSLVRGGIRPWQARMIMSHTIRIS